MSRKPMNVNAKKALEQLKMEISNELSARLENQQNIDSDVTKALVSRAEDDLYDESTFNPS